MKNLKFSKSFDIFQMENRTFFFSHGYTPGYTPSATRMVVFDKSAGTSKYLFLSYSIEDKFFWVDERDEDYVFDRIKTSWEEGTWFDGLCWLVRQQMQAEGRFR